MYRIKEFAKISGLTVQTLRYYDSLNILKPKSTGKYNNYRYYTDEELIKTKAINRLKDLGFKLTEIHNIITKAEKEQFINRKTELEKQFSNTKKALDSVNKIINSLDNSCQNDQDKLYSLIIKEERRINVEEKYQEVKEKLLKSYDLYKEGKSQECYTLLEEIKQVIFSNVDPTDRFWENAAGDLFSAIAFELIKNSVKEDINFINISNFKINGEYYLDKINEYVKNLDKEGYSYLGFKTTANSPQETRSGIIAVFSTELKPYTIKEL
ncbi:MAG TPA: MerR family transcriptional regulator [Bacilli bacterium]|nr:MerR family transcriptional regulator [Bacilli bacterium]